MKRNFFAEAKNLLRKYDYSTTHRIFYGYTIFNLAHFTLLVLLILFCHVVIEKFNPILLFASIDPFVYPVTILLGFVVGFLQFASAHVKFKYIHARILTANMFFGLAWLYIAQIIIIKMVTKIVLNIPDAVTKKVMDVNFDGSPINFMHGLMDNKIVFGFSGLSPFEFFAVVVFLINTLIMAAIAFVAYDKMLKPTIHKGLTFIVINVASVSMYINIFVGIYWLYSWLVKPLSPRLLFNYILVVLVSSAVAYIIFAIICICMALLAAASRIGSGFLDLQDKAENPGTPARFNRSSTLFDREMRKCILEKKKIDKLQNADSSNAMSFVGEITMIEGHVFKTRKLLWNMLKDVRLKMEEEKGEVCDVFTIYFSTDMPAHILIREMEKDKTRPLPENFIVIDCFNGYAGFGEVPPVKNSSVKVFYSDSESMLNMHMCLRNSYVNMEDGEKLRRDWYVVIIIDSLTSLLNITPPQDLVKLFYHMSWCRKNDATKWCLSSIFALVDREEVRYNAEILSNYYKILSVAQNRINMYAHVTDYDKTPQSGEPSRLPRQARLRQPRKIHLKTSPPRPMGSLRGGR